MEETAVAVDALIRCGSVATKRGTEGESETELSPDGFDAAEQWGLDRGIEWLIGRVESGRHREPSPIGFYFAKLWYYEQLYPLLFTVAELGQAVLHTSPRLAGSERGSRVDGRTPHRTSRPPLRLGA